MTQQKKSLIGNHTKKLYILIAVTAIIAAFKIALDQYSQYESRKSEITQEYMKNLRNRLKADVDYIVGYINHTSRSEASRLRQELKTRVYEAHGIATSIYNRYKKRKSRTEIEQMIHSALTPIRFFDNRGYFFATNLQGYAKLFADKPHLEGKNIISMKDTNGKLVVRSMITVAKTMGEGYVDYTWTKPKTPGNQHKKLAFIKLFKPFGWYIGTGEYLDSFTDRLQKEVISIMEDAKLGKKRHYFAGTFEGVQLTNASEAEHLKDVSKEHQNLIIHSYIKAAQNDGGFTINKEDKMLAYTAGIPKWKWYVGTDTHIDEQSIIPNQAKTEAASEIIRESVMLLSLLFVVAVALSLLIKNLTTNLDKNISIFTKFFMNASNDLKKIDMDKIHYTDFIEPAIAANRMVERLSSSSEEIDRLLKNISNNNMELENILKITYHDLRTPLVNIEGFTKELDNSIRTVLETLSALDIPNQKRGKIEHATNIEIPVALKFIHTNVDQMNLLVQGLQRVSHLGRLEPYIEKTNVNKIVDEIIENFLPALQKENVTISKEVLESCSADKTLLPMIFNNIIENSIKYRATDRESKIKINSQIEPDKVRYEIIDNGIGIESDHANRLFDIFYRRNPNSNVKGDGLGLTLAKQLVEKQNGSISISSNEKHGITVTIEMPKAL